MRISARRAAGAVVCVGIAASIAPAQEVNRFGLVISNDISPAEPSATIQVWAYIDAKYYAFARGDFSVFTPDDPGTFSDPKILLNQKWPPNQDPGVVGDHGDSVEGVVAEQLYIEGLFPDEANPLLLWQATWTTKDFSARDVPVWTKLLKFDVFGSIFGDYTMLAGEAGEAAGTIHVVPGPGGGLFMAAAFALGLRSRRG